MRAKLLIISVCIYQSNSTVAHAEKCFLWKPGSGVCARKIAKLFEPLLTYQASVLAGTRTLSMYASQSEFKLEKLPNQP